MTIPKPERFFEDFEPGMVFEFGDYLMSQDDIIAFATAFDPQPFHLNANPPDGTGHSTLIASGWHTAAATMRMIVDNYISPKTILPSPGFDELRFLKPVHPGDRLHVRITVLDARPSSRKPDRGIVKIKVETFNQNDDPVMRSIGSDFVRRRTIERQNAGQ